MGKQIRINIETQIPQMGNLSEEQKKTLGEEIIKTGLKKIIEDAACRIYGDNFEEKLNTLKFNNAKKTIFLWDNDIMVGRVKIKFNTDGTISMSFLGNKMYNNG